MTECKTTRLPEKICADILNSILEGEYKPSARRPNMRCQTLATSRLTVRQALARLARGGHRHDAARFWHGGGAAAPIPACARFAPLEALPVLDVMRRKDAERAATAMRVHLENALERMFGS